MAKTRTIYTCQTCGAQRSRWEGRCSDCGSWNSFVEEKQASEGAASASHAPRRVSGRSWLEANASTDNAKTIDLRSAIKREPDESGRNRSRTGLNELDRVLGGGLVRGTFALLAGEPGVGKSTLLLQMAAGLSEKLRVLYVSAEESIEQTRLRALRLGLDRQPTCSDVHLATESNLDEITRLVEELKPNVLICDSIQTLYLPELSSAPGTVSQVRECAARLLALAKSSGLSVFLIGHITKEGQVAGPKVLEHMVDVVLSFDGDQSHQYRLLRTLKNRFGAAQELGVFQMESTGLREVANPSELFLEERGPNLIGSAVFASMEGSRPLLVEVQALTTPTPMAMPRRNTIGIETNRAHLLASVLVRHAGLKLHQQDLFINVVGGLRIQEPAVDLALAAAILSTDRELEIPSRLCLAGEIGLTGEVRAIPFAELRVREAAKLGFERIALPKSAERQLKSLPSELRRKVAPVRTVADLVDLFATPINRSRPRVSEGPSPDR